MQDHSVDLILGLALRHRALRPRRDNPREPLWSQYKRVLRPDGVVVLTAAAPYSATLTVSNLPWFRGEWIWRKEQGTGFLNVDRNPLKNQEHILVFSGYADHTYNPQIEPGKPYRKRRKPTKSIVYGNCKNDSEICNWGFRYPTTDLFFPHDPERLHPNQKPVALFEFLIRTYTNIGDCVLDTCMGSGTTSVACINTLRQFIGFESDPSYLGVASKRIREAEQRQSTHRKSAFSGFVIDSNLARRPLSIAQRKRLLNVGWIQKHRRIKWNKTNVKKKRQELLASVAV